MNHSRNMVFLKKYSNWSIEELFDKYIHLQPDSEELYYPESFIKDIHRRYLQEGKIALDEPICATWDIVKQCNLICVFCSANVPYCRKEKIRNPLAVDIAKKIIECGIKYISIRGGEPTLCDQLAEVVLMFIQNNVFVEIVTNGRYLDNEFLNAIKSADRRLLRIKISLDSYDEQTNDKQRGKKSFFYASKAMQCCKEKGYPYRIQMVLTKNNYHQLLETYKYCENMGASSFGAMILLPIGRGKDSKISISLNKDILAQLIEILEKKSNLVLEKIGLGIDSIKVYTTYLANDKDIEYACEIAHLKCNGYKTRIYINPEGMVYPCDLLQVERYCAGNILEGQFWKSNVANEFRKEDRKNRNKCKDCKVYGCNMGCPAMTLRLNQKISDVIPNCEV